MSLLTGFAQPIEQSQQAFRLILKALSEPGYIVTLPASPAWGALNAASTAALLTLADQETPIQLCLALESEQVLTNIRFHSGAPLANNSEEVCFALFDAQLQATDLQALPHGSEISPAFWDDKLNFSNVLDCYAMYTVGVRRPDTAAVVTVTRA